MQRPLDRRMETAEERKIAAMVPRIVRQLRSRPSRRSLPSRRGSIRLRGLLRENLRYGGVPFVLPRRVRRRRPVRVLLLVDVSWSAARSAGLFLSIALRFLESAETGRRSRIFLFVDTPIEATEPLRRWVRPKPAGAVPRNGGDPRRRGRAVASAITATPGGVSFASLLAALSGLNPDAPSDYGRVFFRLARRERPTGRDTVLVVLGDGRVNRFDPLPWAFEEIASRCRSVIWIAPESLERWGSADSALHEYLPYCDVAVEARDLTGLARGVRELLRSM